jgi:hypothetical protein
MKIKTILAAASMLAVAFTGAQAQTSGSGTAGSPYIINLTGATAFRAASNNTLLQLLGGVGVTQYAFTGTQGLDGSNRAIFKGTIGSTHYIVRTSWSGSTAGIRDLADASAIQFLTVDNTMSTSGINLGATGQPAPTFENAVARWAFSDVDKLLSTRPNAPLGGGPVGVVPFMFIMGEGGSGMNNMTDQVHNALWSQGQLSAVFLGGDPDLTVLATGRNDGSGTRATILAETGYGAFTRLIQYNATFTGDRLTGSLGAVSEFDNEGNGGHGSNSGVRDLLTRDNSTMTFDGEEVDAVFCSYLTISDALSATGYNEATGEWTPGDGEGAIPMTYNGVRYSEANVKNGAYTLWGYQQLYQGVSATSVENTFDAALRAAVPANMGTAGIPIPDMNVTRFGGDGGVVLPNSEE